MMGLTRRQSELFEFVKARIEAGGIAPSYDEIAGELHLRSRGNINRIVNQLVERGALTRLPGKARALSIGAGLFVSPHPEVRRAIEAYAKKNHISVKTAAEEALRVYFVEASAG